MNKICCVGDANICSKSSSCSMILRSACSHRHSPESSPIKEQSLSSSTLESQYSSAVSKTDSNNGSLNHLKLSLHQIASTEFYESFKISNSSSQNTLSATSLNVQQFSVLNNSSVLKSSEECNDYSSDIRNNKSLNSASSMPEPRRYSRNNLRTLSDDENSDITVDSISRKSRRYSSQKNFISQESGSRFSSYIPSYNIINNASSFEGNRSHINRGSSDGDGMSRVSESSHVDQSYVQYSLFDKFRWFLWRYTYLMIIRFVSFDVWLLSRMSNYRKLFAIFTLLPLLILVWYTYPSSLPHSEVLQAVTHLTSTISTSFSSIYALLILPKAETVPTSDAGSCATDSTSFSVSNLLTPVSTWMSNIKESVFSVSAEENHQESLYHQDEDSSHLINRHDHYTKEISNLKDEIKSLKLHLKSLVSETERNKMESDRVLEIRTLDEKFESLFRTTEILKNDILKQTEKKEEILKRFDHIDIKLKVLEENLHSLDHLKNCHEKQWTQKDFEQLEKYLILAFKNIVNATDNSKYHFFNGWIDSKVSDNEKIIMQYINEGLKRQSSTLESKINYENIVKDVKINVLKQIDLLKQDLSESSKAGCVNFSQDLFAEDKVKLIVNEAIKLYDADKTGKVDYALESGGGSVVGTRCSETYVEKSATMSIFGVPFWTITNSPRTAIQPDVQPGQCWAFKGSHGFLVVELSATIYPSGFTLEHIPVSLSPTGSIDSAPKNFSVWGLDSEKDNKGFLLGEYSYDSNDTPLQYFPVQKPSEKPYSHIELKVHSNHGNMEYTCLYRFRVHGKRAK